MSVNLGLVQHFVEAPFPIKSDEAQRGFTPRVEHLSDICLARFEARGGLSKLVEIVRHFGDKTVEISLQGYCPDVVYFFIGVKHAQYDDKLHVIVGCYARKVLYRGNMAS